MNVSGAVADRLAGDLLVSNVREMAFNLSSLKFCPGETKVDCSGIERIDVAGLQLLVALRKSAALAGGDMIFANRSEALSRALDRAGLDL